MPRYIPTSKGGIKKTIRTMGDEINQYFKTLFFQPSNWLESSINPVRDDGGIKPPTSPNPQTFLPPTSPACRTGRSAAFSNGVKIRGKVKRKAQKVNMPLAYASGPWPIIKYSISKPIMPNRTKYKRVRASFLLKSLLIK